MDTSFVMLRLNEVAEQLKPIAGYLGFSRLGEIMDLKTPIGHTQTRLFRLFPRQVYVPLDALCFDSRVRRLIDFAKPDFSAPITTVDQLVIAQDLRWFRWKTVYRLVSETYAEALSSTMQLVVDRSSVPEYTVWLERLDKAIDEWIVESMGRRSEICTKLEMVRRKHFETA
ncbi:MAG TPA: hypothetical protein VI981_03785 [Candidatus Paceibacterota bacterium]